MTAAADQVIEISGDVAAPALAALSLAGLALGGALVDRRADLPDRARRTRRRPSVCSVVLSAALALARARSCRIRASVVTKATGVSGVDAVASLVNEVTVRQPGPVLALVLGAGMCALGIVIVADLAALARASRKYQAARSPSRTRASDASIVGLGRLCSDATTDPTSR